MEKKDINLKTNIDTSEAEKKLSFFESFISKIKAGLNSINNISLFKGNFEKSIDKTANKIDKLISSFDEAIKKEAAYKPDFEYFEELSINIEGLKMAINELEEELENAEFGSEKFKLASQALGFYKDKLESAEKAVKKYSSLTPILDRFSSVNEKMEAGFSGAQAAADLFGLESTKLAQILDKVTKAQVVLSSAQKLASLFVEKGIPNIKSFGKGQENLSTSLGKVTKSQRILNTVMAANVIMAIVAAVATLASYWDDIKGAISGVSGEQKEVNKTSAAIFENEKKILGNIEARENLERQSGKNEKQILQYKNEQLDRIIAAGEADIQNQEITLAAQVEAERRNKAILKGILEFVSGGITPILHLIDLAGKAFGEDWGLADKFTDFAASQLFDPEETEKKGQETIQAAKASLEELRNQKAGNDLRIDEIDKENYEKWKENFKKRTEEELRLAELKNELTQKQELDALEKLHDNKIVSQSEYEIKKQEITNKWAEIAKQKEQERNEAISASNQEFLTDEAKDFEKRLKGVNYYYDREKSRREKEFAEGKISEQAYNNALLDIETKRLNTTQEFYQNHHKSILDDLKTSVEAQKSVVEEQKTKGLLTEEEYTRALAFIDEDFNNIKADLIEQHSNENLDLETKLGENEVTNIKAINDEKKRIEEETYKYRIDIAQNASNILGSLSELITKKGKEQTDAQKALALVQLGIDTAIAISNTIRNTTSPSIDNQFTGGIAGIAKYITISAQILRAATQAKSILSSGGTNSGGASSGAAAPSISAPQIPAPQFGGTEIQSNQNTPEPIKVFVTEADIRNARNKVNVIEGQSVVV